MLPSSSIHDRTCRHRSAHVYSIWSLLRFRYDKYYYGWFKNIPKSGTRFVSRNRRRIILRCDVDTRYTKIMAAFILQNFKKNSKICNREKKSIICKFLKKISKNVNRETTALQNIAPSTVFCEKYQRPREQPTIYSSTLHKYFHMYHKRNK